MKICLVGSILRHRINSPSGIYEGWGGMTESAVAPFAALLNDDSIIYFIGKVGKEDVEEVKEFFKNNYPLVDVSGIGINPSGTDLHDGTKDLVKVKLRVEPTRYEEIEPYIKNVDVVLFNFGNIDDIEPEAIKKVKEAGKAFVYVDVHRKPFGVDESGYIYSRGWPDWRNHLKYADAVQMNDHECQALFQTSLEDVNDFSNAATELLNIGIRQVIITMGQAGALLALAPPNTPYEYILIPAAPSRVIDSTGSGDAFAAGYLVGLHEGKSPIGAAKLGSVLAAKNCEFLGYMKGVKRHVIDGKKPNDLKHLKIHPKTKK